MAYMMSKEDLHTKLGESILEYLSKYCESMKKVEPIFQNILKNKTNKRV